MQSAPSRTPSPGFVLHPPPLPPIEPHGEQQDGLHEAGHLATPSHSSDEQQPEVHTPTDQGPGEVQTPQRPRKKRKASRSPSLEESGSLTPTKSRRSAGIQPWQLEPYGEPEEPDDAQEPDAGAGPSDAGPAAARRSRSHTHSPHTPQDGAVPQALCFGTEPVGPDPGLTSLPAGVPTPFLAPGATEEPDPPAAEEFSDDGDNQENDGPAAAGPRR